MSAEVIQGDMDRGFWTGVNMEQELFANIDGLVYPIVEWRGPDTELCPKEEAVFAIAGRGFRWFCVHLGEFGIGPWAERYKDPEFLAKIHRDSGRLPEGEDAERSGAAECEASQSGVRDSERIAQPSPPSPSEAP